MSEILRRWRAGEGLPGILVIDGHTHLPIGDLFGGRNTHVAQAVAESLASMDANGVDAACVLSGGFMVAGADYTRGNDVLLEAVRLAPNRLIGFAHINPNDTRKGVLAELARMHQAGLRCIKLLNSYQQGYPGDGPNLMEVYQFAAEHHMLVLNHGWSNEVLSHIAAEFPTVTFIAGHYGHGHDPLLRKFPNVYANIWGLGDLGFLERGIAGAGAEKLLFGSDAFINPQSVGIGLVVYAAVPDAQKRLILGETQARLLREVGALPPGLMIQ